MQRLTENKIILISRRTRLEELIVKYNTLEQAKFYVEHLGSDFNDYLKEQEQYHQSLLETRRILESLGRVQSIERTFLPNFIFGKNDIVIALGQDGLVANTLKYLDSHPLIGVNPDPHRWDGVLLPFQVKDLSSLIPEVFAQRRPFKEITMAKAELNTGQKLYGVNDIFIGPKSHTSARYTINISGKAEEQSSSGVIVSTGLGSTGWLKSLVTGAAGITHLNSKGSNHLQLPNMSWDTDYLYYTVREPFPSKSSAASLVFGKIKKGNTLKLISNMSENGIIFSDGIEADYMEFNSGVEANVLIAEKKGLLVT